MKVRDRIAEVALEKGLARSTVLSYRRFFTQIGIIDTPLEDLEREDVEDAVLRLDNTNTRRSTVIALRSVLGIKLPITPAVPRKYDLPDEDTLRLALMTSPHEIRGLLMAYAGARVGEACAVTGKNLRGANRIMIDKQVQQLHETGKPTTLRIRPAKTSGEVVIPVWLAKRVAGITETAKPDCVRESLRRAGKKVGIDLNPHQLRHWFGTTTLKRSGGNLEFTQKQMRHTNLSSTMIYIDYDESALVESIFG